MKNVKRLKGYFWPLFKNDARAAALWRPFSKNDQNTKSIRRKCEINLQIIQLKEFITRLSCPDRRRFVRNCTFFVFKKAKVPLRN